MQQGLQQNQPCTQHQNRLQLFIHILSWWSKRFASLVCMLAVQFVQEIDAMENLFIRMAGVYAFTSQLLFFMACETALKGPLDKPHASGRKIINSLTSILFYSVFGYFVTKLKEIYNSGRTRFRGNDGRNETIIALFKVVVEWLKAGAVAVCLREQGMKYEQDATYALLTLSYYICTEKLFLETFPQMVACLNLDFMDSLEHFYVPIVMNLYVLILGAIFNVFLSTTVYVVFAAASSYFLIYLRLKDLYSNYIKKLNLEKKTFASFKHATEKELREWNDICAVCLNSMSRARITPCNHFFHPNCLKQCLQVSFKCPLCKQSFVNR